MKKFLQALMLAALFVPFAANAQNDLTVYNDGTATNGYVPVYGFYSDAYLRAHFVYPADVLTDLGTGATISQLTFYASQASVSWGSAEYNVYLAELDDASISAFADVSQMTLVYSGALSISDNQMVVEFDQNYNYSGGNLLIAVEETTTGSYVTSTWYGVTSEGSSVQGYSYSSLSAVSPTQRNFLPKVTITYVSSGAATCAKPATLVASNVTAHEASFTWASTTAGNYQFEYKTAADTVWTDITLTDTTYTLTGLQQNTAYNARVKAICGVDSESGYKTVNFATQLSCPAPTDLTVSLTPGDGTVATISWNAGGEETAWQICLNDDETNLIDVYGSTYTFTGLTPEQTYTAKVRAYCDATDQSSWSSSVTFQPTEKTVIGSGTATSSYLPTYAYYSYSLTQQIYTANELGNAGAIMSIDYFCTAERSRNIDVYMVSTDKQTFESATDWIAVTSSDLVFSGTVDFAANEWTTITLDDPFVYDGVNNVAIIVDDNTGSWLSGTYFYVFADSSRAIHIYSDGTDYDPLNPSVYNGTVMQVKNQIRVAMGNAPTCFRPTELAVTNVTANSVTISWNDSINSGATYTVYNGENVVASGINTTSYTITGLDAITTYTFGVVANCSADDASNMVTVTATTECEGGNCFVYVYAQDSWGDGWNGASISLIQGNVTMASYEMASQSMSSTTIYDTAALSVCAGMPINFSWESGSYDTEITFEIANANEDLIFEAAGAELPDSVFLSIESCTAEAVVDTIYEEVTTCDQYFWNDTTYTESGIYTHETALHVYILDLTVNYSSIEEETVTAEGSYTWNDNVYTESGEYTYTVEGENGCNIVYILNLTITGGDTIVPVECNTIVVTAAAPFTEGFEAGELSECWSNEGNSAWTVGTGDYSTSTGAHTGDYNVKITHSSTGNVTKLITPVVDLTALTTPRLTFWFVNRSWAGDIDVLTVYYRTSETDTNWTMVDMYNDAHSEWTMASITLPTTAAQVAFKMTDNYGYGVAIDDVTIGEAPVCGDVIYTTETVTACDSYDFNGQTYYESDTIVAMFTAANGCDSAEVTLALTVNESVINEVSVETDDDYVWNGETYTVSGVYTYTAVAANGCDSVVELHLTIVPPCSNTCQITIAGEDSYGDGWNGATISVIQSGNVVGTFGFTYGHNYTENISVCADYPVSFAWNSGNYDGEATFTIYNGAMEVVYSFDSGVNASTLPDSVFYTMTSVSCPVSQTIIINATSSDASLGTVYGGGEFMSGDNVVLVALPEAGSQFNGWNNGAVNNPLTFVATESINIVANFTAGGIVTPDTVIVTVTEYDTVTETVTVHDTVTVTETVTVHDTVTVTETVTVHDTVTVTETVTVTDTVTVTETVTVTDTVTVTETVTDTVTVVNTDTITVTETIVDTLYITEYVHDTIIIHDTVYITPEGIDGIDALNAKVYVSEGQIVVEGAEGNNVVLYDISGRVLANKRDDFNVLRFEAPASGSYLIRIGNHPARRIVVIK